MISVPPSQGQVVGGVDTHQDPHIAAVLNQQGAVLGVQHLATTRHDYLALIAWMRGFGVECTCSYGAGSPGT